MGRKEVVLSDSQKDKLALPKKQRFEVWVDADGTGDGPVVLPIHSPLFGEYGLYQYRPALSGHVYAFYTLSTLALSFYLHRLKIYREQGQMQAQQQAIEDVRYLLGLWSFLAPADKAWIEQERLEVVAALNRAQDPTKRAIHHFLEGAALLDGADRQNPGKARRQYTAALAHYPVRDEALVRTLHITHSRAWRLRQRLRRYNGAIGQLVRLLTLAGRLPEGLAIQEFAVPERILRQDKPGHFLVHVIRRLERIRPDALNDPGIARRLEEAVRFEGSQAWFMRPFARLDSDSDAQILQKRSIILAELMERRAFLTLETIDSYTQLIERLQAATYRTGLTLQATAEHETSLTAAREAARATLALVRYRLDEANQPTGEWYMTPRYHDQLRLGNERVTAR
ncbi:MAG TPA: hypothetical protein VK963_01025 [Candidatus Saccharimonadales bacterium]|nr:hypothetical protein [Candidatus Saccharimonadales bacterium]